MGDRSENKGIVKMARSSFNPRDVPLIGGDIAKIGHIIDMWSSPCSTTPTIWVKAAWHAIPYVLWSIYKPELRAISITKGGRSHSRKPKWKFDLQGVTGTTVLGDGLPKWARFAGAFEQRIMFYWLVADAAIDGALNWTSMVMQWSGCPVEGGNHVEMTHDDWFFVPAGVWQSVTYTKIESQGHGLAAAGNSIVKSGDYVPHFASGAVAGKPPGALSVYQCSGFDMRIRNKRTNVILGQSSSSPNQNGDPELHDINTPWLSDDFDGEYVCEFMIHGNSVAGGIRNIYFNGYGIAAKFGILADP